LTGFTGFTGFCLLIALLMRATKPSLPAAKNRLFSKMLEFIPINAKKAVLKNEPPLPCLEKKKLS
jgi:hypothetical protein